jgi:anthranilate 1,2-dioxygenase ferredoxin subunit
VVEWNDVAPGSMLAEGEAIGVTAAGKPIALFRLDGRVFALHDVCPHGEARFSEGYIDGGNVECPLHQGLVCIRTGEPMSAPIYDPVEIFPAREAGGRIEVQV